MRNIIYFAFICSLLSCSIQSGQKTEVKTVYDDSVINRINLDRFKYPYSMVGFISNESSTSGVVQNKCNATVVSERFAITLAKCVSDKLMNTNKKLYFIRYFSPSGDINANDIRTETVEVYRAYGTPKTLNSIRNSTELRPEDNWALLELKSRIYQRKTVFGLERTTLNRALAYNHILLPFYTGSNQPRQVASGLNPASTIPVPAPRNPITKCEIKQISEDGTHFYHNCTADTYAPGAPIFGKKSPNTQDSSYVLIGIHVGQKGGNYADTYSRNNANLGISSEKIYDLMSEVNRIMFAPTANCFRFDPVVSQTCSNQIAEYFRTIN